VTFGAIVVFGYLLGSCPWGYWLVRLFRGEDVRKVGSGNIGATNVWRSYGRSLGLPVMLLDLLKGFVPAFVGVSSVSHLCGIAAGAAAMLGHSRPIFMGFQKGGKMVATGAGVFFAIAPLATFTAGLVWLLVFLVTRYVSVASITGAIAVPILTVVYGYPWPVVVFAILAASAVIYLHRANLSRLRSGTELRVRLRRPVRA
jgi:acyl phosphate:glycerol-3-phosphate acyltransferase